MGCKLKNCRCSDCWDRYPDSGWVDRALIDAGIWRVMEPHERARLNEAYCLEVLKHLVGVGPIYKCVYARPKYRMMPGGGWQGA